MHGHPNPQCEDSPHLSNPPPLCQVCWRPSRIRAVEGSKEWPSTTWEAHCSAPDNPSERQCSSWDTGHSKSSYKYLNSNFLHCKQDKAQCRKLSLLKILTPPESPITITPLPIRCQHCCVRWKRQSMTTSEKLLRWRPCSSLLRVSMLPRGGNTRIR